MVAPSSGPSTPRPSARWFALPLILLLAAVAVLGIVAALRWDQRDGGDPVVGRVGGAETRLVGDADYDVYADGEAVSVGGPGTACTLVPRDGSQGDAVQLRDDRGGAAATEVPRDGRRFVYVGSFTSPVSGDAAVTCVAAYDGMLLQRRGGALLPPAAVLAAAALALLAAVTFAAITLRRRP